MPSCLATGIPKNGYTELVFDFPSDATRIKGQFEVLGGGGAVTGMMKIGSLSVPLGSNDKKSGSFSIPMVPGTGEVTLVFSSNTKVRICVEAVALLDPR